MNFIVNNQEHFETNSAVQSVNTRNNSLPSSLTSLTNKKAQFKVE
jgi:hypothetical protein